MVIGTMNGDDFRAFAINASPANIHKVIDPLFLDNLIERFQTITRDETLGSRARKNRLIELHKDMCGMSFFEKLTSALIRLPHVSCLGVVLWVLGCRIA